MQTQILHQMRTLIPIALFSFSFLFGDAQEKDLSSIDKLMSTFYQALEEENAQKRQATLTLLFTRNGQISSVNHYTGKPSKVKSGTWQSFFEGSTPLYASFSVANDEVERNVDYYGDIASVNSLFYQTLTNKSNSKKYAQLYWIQIELVFVQNRWHIDYASWSNQYDNIAVEEAILSDTVWHKLSK